MREIFWEHSLSEEMMSLLYFMKKLKFSKALWQEENFNINKD
jgi:hypothetical protein